MFLNSKIHNNISKINIDNSKWESLFNSIAESNKLITSFDIKAY